MLQSQQQAVQRDIILTTLGKQKGPQNGHVLSNKKGSKTGPKTGAFLYSILAYIRKRKKYFTNKNFQDSK